VWLELEKKIQEITPQKVKREGKGNGLSQKVKKEKKI